jgi:xanthine dehydrogenase molybdopterin-binding subunit B
MLYNSGCLLEQTKDFKDLYDWKTNSGTLYRYFVYGAACSEVEIDALTGESRILRSDLLLDLGASLNPAVDFGQIEGTSVSVEML